MFRNYLAAALRNLVRNRLYAAINIVGLAVGFAAALLIALFVRDEFSYDTWIPGHEQAYRVFATLTISAPGHAPEDEIGLPADAAAWVKLDLPTVEDFSRDVRVQAGFRHGDMEAEEALSWVDPDFFSIVRLPSVAGDVAAALRSPDNVVITRRTARKYFGSAAPIGEILELNRQHPLRVAAVVEDLPSNTTLNADVFASLRASFSPLAETDSQPVGKFNGLDWTPTYLGLPEGVAAADVEAALGEAVKRHYPKDIAGVGLTIAPHVVPLSAVHLLPMFGASAASIGAISAIGVLIVIVAAINFLNLMTARATRRAVEVGVRKAAGAFRKDLMIQFLGESFIYVLAGALAGVVLAVPLLSQLNAFFQRAITFEALVSPWLILGAVGAIVAVGIAAGSYPAFVLSGFAPAVTVKGGQRHGGAGDKLRRALVVVQFAILIGLTLATTIIYRQTDFAIKQSLQVRDDQLLLVLTPCANGGFKEAVSRLPGVRGIACSSYYILGSRNGTVATLADGRKTEFSRAASDYDLLELYDLRPLAGRFFSRDRAVDAPPSTWGPTQGSIVINETMMRGMGYARAEDAVGQRFSWVNPTLQFPSLEPRVSTVIGVAPDFKTRSVTDAIAPTVFFIGDETRPENGVVEGLQLINLKISRTDIPQTLRAIDRVWRDVGAAQPIRRTFLNEHVERMYRGIMRQSTLLAVFAVTAIFIAALGLFGLAAFTAEQRTKEIGVRKAMGASSGDILRLLVWDFAKPVLWANVIAWPVGYVIMARWLQGFTYHIDLELWVFADASLLALAIAVATVSGHALRVARRQPVSALRYE